MKFAKISNRRCEYSGNVVTNQLRTSSTPQSERDFIWGGFNIESSTALLLLHKQTKREKKEWKKDKK